jgi:glutaredoxin
MDKLVVVYSMVGCPFCTELKEMLDKEDLNYVDRDIDKYKDEYDIFVEITENEYVPAFMTILDPDSERPKTKLYAPDRDFDDLEEGLKIIKNFYEE